MKRDMDLIRQLVILFRDKEGPEMIKEPKIDGYDMLMVKYHCVLLHDAGLLRCEPVLSKTSDRVIDVHPFELTWDGHEFADKILSDTIWNRVKSTVKQKGGVLAFQIVNELATRYALEAVQQS